MGVVITLQDKQFKPYISQEKIGETVKALARRMNAELINEFPVFLVVLNGAFMFASDLLKEITIACEISFIKLASYVGTRSMGEVSELIGLTGNVKDRTVVIIEDIVDTGLTVEKLEGLLKGKGVKDIKVATLLIKPDCYKHNRVIDYSGISIGNEFVVGYGLDYRGIGRNLKEIYVLA